MTAVGVFLNRELRTGGHTRYLELMEGLARRGHRVVVLLNGLLQYAPISMETIRLRVPYRRRSFPPASLIFAMHARQQGRLLRERTGKADAVVVFGGTHLAAGAVLARDLSAGLVYGHRSNAVREELTLLSEPQQRPFGRLAILTRLAKARHEERRIARLADLVVFQSAYDRDDFRSRVPLPDARTAIIRGDISNPRFEGRYAGINRSTTAARILFIGALSRRKGIDYLIKAIALLRERGHRNLRFEFCGPGDRQNELQKDLSIRGISDIVAIRGRVADPFKVISESDLLVVPSLMDSYPNTVLEALHVGTPVIGSRVGGIPDQLVHDELLFPPMDAAAIADRIERCVREPGFYQLIQELCRSRRAAFCFDWAEAWEKAITSCTQK